MLFYGYYDSGQNEPYRAPPPNSQPFLSPLHYKLPLAYALLIPGIFLLYCIAILVKYVQLLSSQFLPLSLTKLYLHFFANEFVYCVAMASF